MLGEYVAKQRGSELEFCTRNVITLVVTRL